MGGGDLGNAYSTYRGKNNYIFNLVEFNIHLKYKVLKYERVKDEGAGAAKAVSIDDPVDEENENDHQNQIGGGKKMTIDIVTKNLQINI